MSQCPRGTTFDPRSGYCIADCLPGYSYNAGECVQSCPPGTVLNDQKICIRPVFSRSNFVNENASQSSVVVFGLTNLDDEGAVSYAAFSDITKETAFSPSRQTDGPVTQVLKFTNDNNAFYILENQTANSLPGTNSTFRSPVQGLKIENVGESFEKLTSELVNPGPAQRVTVPEIRKAVYMPSRKKFLAISDTDPSQVLVMDGSNNLPPLTFNSPRFPVAYDHNKAIEEILFFTGGVGIMNPQGLITYQNRPGGGVTNRGYSGTNYGSNDQRFQAAQEFDVVTSLASRRFTTEIETGYVVVGYKLDEPHAFFTTDATVPPSGLTNVAEVALNFDGQFGGPVGPFSSENRDQQWAVNVFRVDNGKSILDPEYFSVYVFFRGNVTTSPVPILSYIYETTPQGTDINYEPTFSGQETTITTSVNAQNDVLNAEVSVGDRVQYTVSETYGNVQKICIATQDLPAGSLVYNRNTNQFYNGFVAEDKLSLVAWPQSNVCTSQVTASYIDPVSNFCVFGTTSSDTENVVTYSFTYDALTASQLPAQFGTVNSMENVNSSKGVPSATNPWTGATLPIPANTTRIHVILWGAGGSCETENVSDGTGSGGAGAFVEGDLDPTLWTPGYQNLEIVVGLGGLGDTANFPLKTFGGGGAGRTTDQAGQGGGRTCIVINGVEYVTAAGGGGSLSTGIGGAAGIDDQVPPEDGFDLFGKASLACGKGARFNIPGAGGVDGATVSDPGTASDTDNGYLASGGNSDQTSSVFQGGGGGGGGFFGGGGAADSLSGAGGGICFTDNILTSAGNTPKGFKGTNHIAPQTNHPFYPGSPIANGGVTSSSFRDAVAFGGNGFAVIQFFSPAVPNPNEQPDSFSGNRALSYFADQTWPQNLGSDLLVKQFLFQNQEIPLGNITAVSVSTSGSLGVVLCAIQPVASEYNDTINYSPGSTVSYDPTNSGEDTIYQCIAPTTAGIAPADSNGVTNRQWWIVHNGADLYYTTFTFQNPQSPNEPLGPYNVNQTMQFLNLKPGMSMVNSIRPLQSQEITFVIMGSGIRVAKYKSSNGSWSFSNGKSKDSIPNFDSSFSVIDGGYSTNTNTFSFGAIPRKITLGVQVQTPYTTKFADVANDPDKLTKLASYKNIVVATGGPFVDSFGVEFPVTDYTIRYLKDPSSGLYSGPYVYYQNEPLLIGGLGSLTYCLAQNLYSQLPDINAPLIVPFIRPYFSVRSPANLAVSVDGGNSFVPIQDGTSRIQKLTNYVYTLFEGTNNAPDETNRIMKSVFRSVLFIPGGYPESGSSQTITGPFFVASGSFLWDINTISGPGTFPTGALPVGTNQLLGNNVMWISQITEQYDSNGQSTDGLFWIPITIQENPNDTIQTGDQFWNCLNLSFVSPDRFFLTTDFAMYTFTTSDIYLPTGSGSTYTLGYVNASVMAYKPPYGATCTNTDQSNNCITCPKGSFEETINVLKSPGSTETIQESLCLTANSKSIADNLAQLYNGFDAPTQQIFTDGGTYAVPANVSDILVNLWGSGGGNPANQSGAFVSGGSGAYVSAKIPIYSPDPTVVTVKSTFGINNQSDPVNLYIVVGKIGSNSGTTPDPLTGCGGVVFTPNNSQNSNVGGNGGGFTAIFYQPPNTSPTDPANLFTASNLLLIVGGGGGGGTLSSGGSVGGGGGILNGQSGTPVTTNSNVQPGTGGTGSNVPVTNWTYSASSSNSASGGNVSNSQYGGAGGGGYVGGLQGGFSGSSNPNGQGGGGGGGASYIRPFIQVLDQQSGRFCATFGGEPALPGGNYSPFYQAPYGQSNNQGYAVLLQSSSNKAFLRVLPSGLQFVGLCNFAQAIINETPTIDDEFLCPVDECLIPNGTRNSVNSYIYDTSMSFNPDVGTKAFYINPICPLDSINQNLFGFLFSGNPIQNPSLTDFFANASENGQVNPVPITITTNTFNNSYLDPTAIIPGTSSTTASNSMVDYKYVPNWTSSPNVGYVSFMTDASGNTFMNVGVSNISIQDIVNVSSNTNLLGYFTNAMTSITNYSNAFNAQSVPPYLSGAYGILPTSPPESSSATLALLPTPSPANPNPILVAPFTLSKFTATSTNISKLMSINFYRPRNWGFVMEPALDLSSGILNYCVLSDQPNEQGQNEFIYPDPWNQWSTLQNADPLGSIIVCGTGITPFHYYDTNLSIQKTLWGSLTPWFGTKPIAPSDDNDNTSILYGINLTFLPNGQPYGFDNSLHTCFTYISDQTVTSNSNVFQGVLGPRPQATSFNAVVNVFLNVSKLTDNSAFDWGIPSTWTTGPAAFTMNPVTNQTNGETLLQFIGVDTQKQVMVESGFNPMQNFIFTDPNSTVQNINLSGNVQYNGAALNALFNNPLVPTGTENNINNVSPIWTFNNSALFSNQTQSVLIGTERLMVANWLNPSTYDKTWEATSSSDFSAYVPPVLDSSNATKTAYLWFTIGIVLPTAETLSLNSFTMDRSTWFDKQQIVNYTSLTINVEYETTYANTNATPQIPNQQVLSGTLSDCGPKIEVFQEQPLVFTRYFRDRYGQYSAYFSDVSGVDGPTGPTGALDNQQKLGGFPIKMPYYNPHFVPIPPHLQWDNTLQVLTEDPEIQPIFAGYTLMEPYPNTYTIMDLEYGYVPENTFVWAGSTACTLDDNGANVACNSASQNWAVIGGIPKQLFGTLNVFSMNAKAYLKPGTTDQLRFYNFADSPNLGQNMFDLSFDNTTQNYNVTLNPNQISTSNVAAMYFVPTSLIQDDSNGPTLKLTNCYLSVLNPNIQKANDPYKWCMLISKTRLVSEDGSLTTANKNMGTLRPNTPTGGGSDSQFYSGDFFTSNFSGIYYVDFTTLNQERFTYRTTATAPPTSNQSLMEIYEVDYLSTDSPSLAGVPKVLPFITPNSTYIWDSRNSTIGFEYVDGYGQRYCITNTLASLTDFRNGNSSQNADYIVNIMNQAVGTQNFFACGSNPTREKVYALDSPNNPWPTRINFQKVAQNGQWYLQLSITVHDSITGRYYPDIAVNVRGADPITREVLGMGRITKAFREYTTEYNSNSYPTHTYTLTMPDPMYFGPFSDTVIMLAAVPSNTTTSSAPDMSASAQDPTQSWLKSQANRTFNIAFSDGQNGIPIEAVPTNSVYASFSSNTAVSAVATKNTSLVRSVDNVFSLVNSYENATTNKPNQIVQNYMSFNKTQNLTGIYPDPIGTTVTVNLPNGDQISVGSSSDGFGGTSYLSFRDLRCQAAVFPPYYIGTNIITPLNDLQFIFPNFNGLSLVTSNVASSSNASLPLIHSTPKAPAGFAWVFWPWRVTDPPDWTANRKNQPAPLIQDPFNIQKSDYNPQSSWFYASNLNQIQAQSFTNAQLLCANATNELYVNNVVAVGSSDGYLRKAYFTGPLNGEVAEISKPDTFQKLGLPIRVGPISAIEWLTSDTDQQHIFVLSDTNGVYTTAAFPDNLQTDVINFNLNGLLFGPLFDVTGACAVQVPSTSPLASWSIPVANESNQTIGPVLFMKKITVSNRQILIFGDIYDNLVGLWYSNNKIQYAAWATNVLAPVSTSSYGFSSCTDIVYTTNVRLVGGFTNPQRSLNLGLLQIPANRLQYLPDGRPLWTAFKPKNPASNPLNFDLSNYLAARANLPLPEPNFFNSNSNDVQTLIEEAGQLLTDAIGSQFPILDVNPTGSGAFPVYTITNLIGEIVYPQDAANNPLSTESWASALTIQATHVYTSPPYVPRFILTVNDPFRIPLTYPVNTPPPVFPGTQAPVWMIFDFVAQQFFNIANVQPGGIIQFPAQAGLPPPIGTPYVSFIEGADIAPPGDDQNCPKWFRTAFFKMKSKDITYDTNSIGTASFGESVFTSDYPDNLFSTFSVFSAAEVESNIYISDIAYSPEVDAVIWVPVGTYGPIAVRQAGYIAPNLGNTSSPFGPLGPIESTTSPYFFAGAICAWNPYRSLFYVAGLAIPRTKRQATDESLQPRTMVVQNLVPPGSTNGGTVPMNDNYVETQWISGGLINFLSDKFAGVTAFGFSPTVEAACGYTYIDNPDVPGDQLQVTSLWFRLVRAANDVAFWQQLAFQQIGYITAIQFVGYGWYIATWDPNMNTGAINPGESSLWFASSNFTVIAFVDAWSDVDRTYRVTSIDYALTSLQGTCPTGFEPSVDDPNVCYKTCPEGYEPFNDLCVLSCPNLQTNGIPNQCIPNRYTPNRITPTQRKLRNNFVTAPQTVTQFNAQPQPESNAGSAVKWGIGATIGGGLAATILLRAAGILK